MIGQKFTNASGQEYEVLAREGATKGGNIRFRIRFVHTGYETVVEKVQIQRGKIKDRYSPDIFGVGYLGEIPVSPNKRAYNIWHKMLGRCYDPKNVSYKDYGAKGVYVVKRWHSFELFVHDVPFIDGYDQELYESGVLNLDKDAKQKGAEVKRYSLETCTFMTKAENSALVDREHRKQSFMAVSPQGKQYKVTGMGEFAREHGLVRQGISNCLKKKAHSHKGWIFYRPLEGDES